MNELEREFKESDLDDLQFRHKREVRHSYPAEADFQAGVYRHYKGGLYWAMAIGWVNELEPRERAVFYVSMTTGEWHARPYTHVTKDAWCDEVFVEMGKPKAGPTELISLWLPRFRYVGPQPIPKTHG
jgi:hypothetical protein